MTDRVWDANETVQEHLGNVLALAGSVAFLSARLRGAIEQHDTATALTELDHILVVAEAICARVDRVREQLPKDRGPRVLALVRDGAPAVEMATQDEDDGA